MIQLGKDLKNHSSNYADYFDEKGGYDIVCYLTDFADCFPSLYIVGIGHLCPHNLLKWTVSPYSAKQVNVSSMKSSYQHMHIQMAGDWKTLLAEDLLSCASCLWALYGKA